MKIKNSLPNEGSCEIFCKCKLLAEVDAGQVVERADERHSTD